MACRATAGPSESRHGADLRAVGQGRGGEIGQAGRGSRSNQRGPPVMTMMTINRSGSGHIYKQYIVHTAPTVAEHVSH